MKKNHQHPAESAKKSTFIPRSHCFIVQKVCWNNVLGYNSDMHFEQLTTNIAKSQADQIFIEYPIHLQHELHAMYHSDKVNDAFKQNEIYQIGFRLAKKLRHETIYAADWNEELDASIDLALVAKGNQRMHMKK